MKRKPSPLETAERELTRLRTELRLIEADYLLAKEASDRKDAIMAEMQATRHKYQIAERVYAKAKEIAGA